MSRKSLVSIHASSAATRLIHWAQLGHFASSVDPKKVAARLFQIKLPNKSTGSCFAAAVLTKLCPIKPPPLRPRALLRGVGALNVLDQCSARSPRRVLEMVGASSRRTPRLQFPKHSRDRNAVGKRWGARGSIFRFFGPSCRLARGASEECVSGTLFLQVGWARMKPAGALIC